MNSVINDITLNDQDKTEKLLASYKFALLEINRQISVQCLERGNLLKEIIDSYIELLYRQFYIII